MKKLILAITTLVVLYGCHRKDDIIDGSTYMESFVEDYMPVKSMMVSADSKDGILWLQLYGAEIISPPSAQYEQLAEYYGDTHFNRDMAISHRAVVADDIISIDMVSSADFPGHPAGESLRDIVEIEYETAWPYVSSGYDANEWGNNGGYQRKSLLLSEVMPESLRLMRDWGLSMKFTVAPETKSHTFTVTVTARDPLSPVDTTPLVWSDTVEVTFE